jgi:hypothetical protein
LKFFPSSASDDRNPKAIALFPVKFSFVVEFFTPMAIIVGLRINVSSWIVIWDKAEVKAWHHFLVKFPSSSLHRTSEAII